MVAVRIIGSMVIVVAAVALLPACGDDEPSGGNGATASPTEAQAGEGESPPPGDSFFLEIAAENTEYDVSELGPAPAGEDITLQFDNDDPGIQHNWSLYETEESEDPIFEGEILTGVDTIDYAVPAIDEPGTYHFHCDIHPNVMTGELIIE
jgi:plastocyanin